MLLERKKYQGRDILASSLRPCVRKVGTVLYDICERVRRRLVQDGRGGRGDKERFQEKGVRMTDDDAVDKIKEKGNRRVLAEIQTFAGAVS